MSTLVAVDGVLYDLESSPDAPDGVSAMVGEPLRDEEGDAQPASPIAPRTDAPIP